jgi:predicted cupin superfamily sugar epimerase
MAPGFDWAGFELGRREPLVEQYPAFAPLIAARTHV